MAEIVEIQREDAKNVFESIVKEMEKKAQEIKEEYKEKFGFESYAAEWAVEEMRSEYFDTIPGLEAYVEDLEFKSAQEQSTDLEEEQDSEKEMQEEEIEEEYSL